MGVRICNPVPFSLASPLSRAGSGAPSPRIALIRSPRRGPDHRRPDYRTGLQFQAGARPSLQDLDSGMHRNERWEVIPDGSIPPGVRARS